MRSDNNIERKGKEIDKKKLADLEKIEFDVDKIYCDIQKCMRMKKRSQTFSDWLRSKPIDGSEK